MTALASGALALFTMLNVLLRDEPTLVVAEKAALAETLEGAPWFAWEPRNPEDPAVWLLSRPDCPACRGLERRLGRADAELRLIVVAPRDAGELHTAVAAELARRRDGDAFQTWLKNPSQPLPLPAGVLDVDLGAEAVAGYAELGRATQDRLAAIAAANGLELQVPALIWRRGREWRIAVQPDAADRAALFRDLAAADG